MTDKRIVRGSIFVTEHESAPVYCTALTAPDADGNFDGTDSDGVEVQFNVVQVGRVIRDGDAGTAEWIARQERRRQDAERRRIAREARR